jgi:hypothetical protein
VPAATVWRFEKMSQPFFGAVFLPTTGRLSVAGPTERVRTRLLCLMIKSAYAIASAGRFTTEVPGIPFAFRRPSDDAGRALNEICIPELVALAREVLSRDLGADAAIVAMARDIGLQRLRAASRGRLEQAIALARST